MSDLGLYEKLVRLCEEAGFVNDDVKDMLEQAAGLVENDPRTEKAEPPAINKASDLRTPRTWLLLGDLRSTAWVRVAGANTLDEALKDVSEGKFQVEEIVSGDEGFDWDGAVDCDHIQIVEGAERDRRTGSEHEETVGPDEVPLQGLRSGLPERT